MELERIILNKDDPEKLDLFDSIYKKIKLLDAHRQMEEKQLKVTVNEHFTRIDNMKMQMDGMKETIEMYGVQLAKINDHIHQSIQGQNKFQEEYSQKQMDNFNVLMDHISKLRT